jgi:hypothetical protein
MKALRGINQTITAVPGAMAAARTQHRRRRGLEIADSRLSRQPGWALPSDRSHPRARRLLQKDIHFAAPVAVNRPSFTAFTPVGACACYPVTVSPVPLNVHHPSTTSPSNRLPDLALSSKSARRTQFPEALHPYLTQPYHPAGRSRHLTCRRPRLRSFPQHDPAAHFTFVLDPKRSCHRLEPFAGGSYDTTPKQPKQPT